MPTAVSSRKPYLLSGRNTASVLCTLSAWATLFVAWLLLSGMFTAFLVTAGALCAVAVVALGRRMQVIDGEGHPVHILLRALLSYWPWLVKEIVKSAWDVTRVILHPRLPVSPTLVRFRPSQASDLALVVHGNSITLTPGTICVEAHRDEFLVHALTAAGAAGVGSGSDMDRRVCELEGGR